MSTFIDLQNPQHVETLLDVLDDGSEVKPLAYNVVINLLRFVPRQSFLDLIKIKSAEDTDPKSWKLRALLWRSFLMYNGVVKLVAVKHIPPLTMFSYGPQLFPASLSSIAPLSEELQRAALKTSAESKIYTEESPTWLFVEINLEFCSREPATIRGTGGPDLNMLEMMHVQHAFAVGCARHLTEEIGIPFVPKPLDSLLDKAFFRQKDIHDLIRTRVPEEEVDGVVEQLQTKMNMAVYESKKTKLGNRSVILHGCCTSIWNYCGFVWVEVQQEMSEDEIGGNHVEYEINRNVREMRYQSLLEKQAEFKEVVFPKADDKMNQMFDAFQYME